MTNELRDIATQLKELARRLNDIEAKAIEKRISDTGYAAFLLAHPRWPNLSLAEIQGVVKSADPDGMCGRERALRLRDKAKDLAMLPRAATGKPLPQITPRIGRLIDELNQLFPTRIPRRREALAASSSNSAGQVGAALKHLARRRQAAINA